VFPLLSAILRRSKGKGSILLPRFLKRLPVLDQSSNSAHNIASFVVHERSKYKISFGSFQTKDAIQLSYSLLRKLRLVHLSMKKFLLILSALFLGHFTHAQEAIDGNFAFQSDPAKKYSLYIPSAYQEGESNAALVALHGWNTSVWNGKTWCEFLAPFAEANDVILICPDGGTDGQIDDPIDMDFTTALIDSMNTWYEVDMNRLYAIGFSWGGRTVYTYGLEHTDLIKGFIPVGAAINGVNINNNVSNTAGQPWYLVHGANDSPNSRFYPYLENLENAGAITNSKLMSGVGHTMDFPNRDAILGEAYQWVDSVNIANSVSVKEIPSAEPMFRIAQNLVQRGTALTIEFSAKEFTNADSEISVISKQGAEIYNKDLGKSILSGVSVQIPTDDFSAGLYFVKFRSGTNVTVEKVVVQ